VVQIKYRCIEPEHGNHKEVRCPKYLVEEGCGTHLYNSPVLLSESGLVVVTEGELDALTVQAYCGLAAVGYPGVDTWKDNPHFRLCFEGVNEIVVVADGDEPGRKAAKRVADSLGYAARVLDLPDGEDANSFIASHGAAVFTERVRHG
jgi:DNA primase